MPCGKVPFIGSLDPDKRLVFTLEEVLCPVLVRCQMPLPSRLVAVKALIDGAGSALQ